jgi:hypothetical protein
VAVATERQREQVKARLRDDYPYYFENALKIVTKTGELIPFHLKRPQARLLLQLMAQRDAGEPQRAVLLKARQVGMSTAAQGLVICRATQRANHSARVVAHDRATAASLFSMGRTMWEQLPQAIKPTKAYQNDSIDRKYLQFGEPSSMLRGSGLRGLNSAIQTDTAKEAQAGRGLTIHTLHLSEVAFWDYAAKMDALINAVPEHPDMLILVESTANGHNFFKDTWDLAVGGSSGYLPFFTPWFEEDEYRRPFSSEDERADFEAEVGTGPFGEDEPELLRLIPEMIRQWEQEFQGTRWHLAALSEKDLRTRTLEHLYWRRRRIATAGGGDVERFHQEYPSTPDEAFLATGRKVFNAEHVRRVLRVVERTDPSVPTKEHAGPEIGRMAPQTERDVRSRNGFVITVPGGAVWRNRQQLKDEDRRYAHWRVWEHPDRGGMDFDTMQPQEPGHYVIAVDPASGQENEGELDASSVQVINHRTLEQCAELTVRHLDGDELAREVLLAALYFNQAWVNVERTGGHGVPILRRLRLDYRYPRIYMERSKDRRMEHTSDRMGWSTDSASKPMLIDRGKELLREEVDGIRSRHLALELLYYVMDDRGRTGAEPGKTDDRLMAWLIAQESARRLAISQVKRKSSSSTRPARLSRTGWN